VCSSAAMMRHSYVINVLCGFPSIFVHLYRVIWVPFVNVVVDTGIGWAEEFIKTLLRELTALSYRLLNGISGLFVSLFVDHTSWKRHRRAWSDGDAAEGRLPDDVAVSTLNAIVEREVSEQEGVVD
jgi:hypothetical protein